MGRNKKKSKAAAHAESGGEDEREEVEHDAGLATTSLPDGGEGHEAAAAGKAHPDDDPHGNDSEDEAPTKKKKEYRGNRLNKKETHRGHHTGQSPDEVVAAASAGATAQDDEGDEPLHVTRQQAVEVLYCPICTFPAEMCEFSGMMEKCRPWLLEHAAELAAGEERGRKRRILTEKDRLEAMLEGRGIKKALERIVVLEVEKRTGRRMITSVFGMDLFGFNLKDVSRDWRKRFSCGAGVRAAEEGKHQDCIDIQGNVMDQLAEMLITKYNVPKGSVYMMEGKKKVPYPYE